MKRPTKRSVIIGCVFVLLSAINLVMEYKKLKPSDLIFKWIMLIFFIIFAVVAFIRYKKATAEIEENEKTEA